MKTALAAACLISSAPAIAAGPVSDASSVDQDLRCIAIVMTLSPQGELFAGSDRFFTTAIVGIGYWIRKVVVAQPDIDLKARLRPEISRIADVNDKDEDAMAALASDVQACAAEWMPVMERLDAAFPRGQAQARDDR